MKAIQVSMDRRRDKQNVYPYKGTFFGLKKEGCSNTGCNMDDPGGHYVKASESVTKRQLLFDST